MRNLFLSFIIILTFSTWSHAGVFDKNVDLSDLARLSSEGLQMLKDTEFAVFVGQVKVAGAQSDLKRAQGALKAAGTTLKTKKSFVTTAESKLNEASKKKDAKGTALAETTLKQAEQNLTRAEIFHVWKKQEVNARKTILQRAKLDLAISEAEREKARISRLSAERVPALTNYSLEDIEKSLKKKKKERDTLKRAEEREVQTAYRLKEEYEQKVK